MNSVINEFFEQMSNSNVGTTFFYESKTDYKENENPFSNNEDEDIPF